MLTWQNIFFFFIYYFANIVLHPYAISLQLDIYQNSLNNFTNKTLFLHFLSGLHTANLSCKLVFANFKKLANSFIHTSNSRQIKTHVNLQHGRISAVALTYNNGTEEEKRRNRKRERFGRNSVCPLAPPFFRFVFSIFVDYRWNVPHNRTIVNFFDKVKNGLTFLLTQTNHVNRARALISWQLPAPVCQSFTRQSLPTRKSQWCPGLNAVTKNRKICCRV